RRARRQGRGGDARGAAAALRSGGVHPLRQPARAVAGHAREPGLQAGRAAVRDGRRPSRRARAGTRAGGPRRRRAGHRLDIPRCRPRARRSGRTGLDPVNEREYPSLLTTIGIVALVVATVILVFFGIGYLIGRIVL